ncbi:MAG: ATP-binding protein [Usitatibacter sp.]
MSIRRRLLLWLLSSVLAGGVAAAAVVFFQARSEVNELFDYQLRQLAFTLRDRNFTPSELAQVLQGEDALDFVIEVWGPDGTPLYESHPQFVVPGARSLGLGEVETAQGRWRVFAIRQRGLTIQVAQPMAVRDEFAIAAAARTLVPFVVALPLMGWLIWRLVGRELASLQRAAAAIARRTPESLEPISVPGVPDEIQPLVASLNDLLARLGGAIAHQRQFIADAAHELRTPLTALRLQLQLAERAADDRSRAAAHAALREGILRASHLVEQLLILARQDPDAPMDAVRAIDLAAVARGVLDANAATATARGLSLVAGPTQSAQVAGDPAALRTLADNLVDNALRYTPPGGSITVGAYPQERFACFEVEDTGPGIPPAERGRVFDRFYRGEGAAEGGSGLGLAIVQRIAQRHGGRVELGDARGHSGLLVRVLLPLAQSS